MAGGCVETSVETCETFKAKAEVPEDMGTSVQDTLSGKSLFGPATEAFSSLPSAETKETVSLDPVAEIGHVSDHSSVLVHSASKPEPTSEAKCENKSPKSSPTLSIRTVPHRLRMYVPPVNFGSVEDGHVYRSGYPTDKNFDFIASLQVKTILTLVPEPLSAEYSTFMRDNGIRHVQIHIPANKDGNISITPERMGMALAVVLNRANHPMLIHCNRGKHRTGCVTACFRKVQSMNAEAAITEYQDYASPKCRDDDMRFIRGFDETQVFPFAQSHGWPVTPPPEPSDRFWHLKSDSMTFALEDIAALKLPESDPDQSL